MASAPPLHVVTVHPWGSRVARTSSRAAGSSSMTTMSRRELVCVDPFGDRAPHRPEQSLLRHGLDEVVRGSEREAPAPFGQHGHDDDRGGRDPRVCLDHAEDVPAVHARQVDVQDDGRGAEGPDRRQPLLARAHVDRAQAGGREVHGDELRGAGVVLDDDDGPTCVLDRRLAPAGVGRTGP